MSINNHLKKLNIINKIKLFCSNDILCSEIKK